MQNKLNRTKQFGMVLMAWIFFGLFYPKLCLTEDILRVVSAEGMVQEEIDDEIYEKLLSAEPGEITIKSRLWEIIQAYLEKDKVK